MKQFSFLLCTLLFLSACGDSSSTPDSPSAVTTSPEASSIRIGFVSPTTGEMGKTGSDALAAAQLAAEEINSFGGVDRTDIDIVAVDGKCSLNGGVEAGQKLLEENVVAVVGGLCSSETIGMTQALKGKNIPVVSYCASAADLSDVGNFFFRTIPSETLQADFAARYVRGALEKEKAVVLSVDTTYSFNLAKQFSDTYSLLGGNVVQSAQLPADITDFSEIVSGIKKSDAEIVYFTGKSQASKAFLAEAQKQNLSLPFFGIDALNTPEIFTEEYTPGIFYVAVNTARPDAWKMRIAERNITDTTCVARAYDTTIMLADMIKNTGTDFDTMIQNLNAIKDYPGMAGNITFNANGDLSSAEYVVFQMEEGKPVRQN